MGNTDTQDSPRPGLGGSHHLPPYSILYTSPPGPHPNGFSFPGLLNGSLEIAPAEILVTLEPHNFARKPWIEVQSSSKVVALAKSFPTVCDKSSAVK